MNGTTDADLIKSVTKFVCGDSRSVCRLCLHRTDSPETEEISIHEFVRIKTPYYNDQLTYLSIFHELGVPPDPVLPEVLCLNCATLTVNAYLFPKLCQYSQLQWQNSLASIDKIITQSESLNARTATAYFIVGQNETSIFTCYNQIAVKNRQSALTTLKKNMRIRLQKIRDKKRRKQKRFPCPSCTKVFLKAYELEYHKEKLHYPKIIKCGECSKMFSTEKQLRKHKNLYHIKFTCKLCSMELPSKYLLGEHMDKHYRNSCAQCDKQFKSLRSYRLHMKLCGQQSKFICDICSKVYSQKKYLLFHLERCHGFGKNLLSCDWCDKKFHAKSRLNDHIVKHTRERKFTCEICGGKFVTNPALTYHMRRHTGERPYPCDMCDKRFLSASIRLVHQRRAHLGPTMECDICQAKFITSNELNKHKKWHFNPRSKLYVEIDSIPQNED